MIGKFDEYDDWNEVTDSTAVPLSCLQMLWEKDKVYTQNHFSRDYVVVSCLIQQVKLGLSGEYIMTAFAPKLWLNTADSLTASSDEGQTYEFRLVNSSINVDRANKLETLTPIFVKCKLDKYRSKGTVAFDETELLADYKTPVEDFTLLPYVKNRIVNTKNLDSFMRLVLSITNWSREECVALYFNINKLGQDIPTGAININTTLTQHGEDLTALVQSKQEGNTESSSAKDVVKFIIGVIIVIFLFKSCIGG